MKFDPLKSKYTIERMMPLVRESRSYCELIRKLGLKVTGSANSRIRLIVKTLNLSTSHFIGKYANRGETKRGGNKRLPYQIIFTLDRRHGRKETASVLRRALQDSGVPELCEECSLGPTWNGRPLRLQVDHRNGNCLDNRQGNPRFLCPNCHTQTDTYGSKNILKMTREKITRKNKVYKKRIWRDGHKVYQ